METITVDHSRDGNSKDGVDLMIILSVFVVVVVVVTLASTPTALHLL